MRWATSSYSPEFVVKVDDDTFLRVDLLFTELQGRPRERLFYGHNLGYE